MYNGLGNISKLTSEPQKYFRNISFQENSNHWSQFLKYFLFTRFIDKTNDKKKKSVKINK